jgi:CBS domain-containing protein
MKITAYISDILSGKTGDVWTIESHATVFDAIRKMAEKNIGAMPVVDGGELVGLISERDYTRKVALMGKSSRETKVSEIMASPVITVTPTATVDTCMQLVSRKRVRHLPVIEDGRLIGMISIGDLVNWTISAQSAAIEQMESYIMGGYAG